MSALKPFDDVRGLRGAPGEGQLPDDRLTIVRVLPLGREVRGDLAVGHVGVAVRSEREHGGVGGRACAAARAGTRAGASAIAAAAVIAVAACGQHEDGENDGRETEELSTADRHAISFRWPGRDRGGVERPPVVRSTEKSGAGGAGDPGGDLRQLPVDRSAYRCTGGTEGCQGHPAEGEGR